MKHALGLLALLAAAGCGVESDDRPATTEYITEAILRPSCATGACHNSQNQREGIILDTVAGVTALGSAEIYGVVSSSDNEIPPRMPLDGPLPDADIALIATWAGI